MAGETAGRGDGASGGVPRVQRRSLKTRSGSAPRCGVWRTPAVPAKLADESARDRIARTVRVNLRALRGARVWRLARPLTLQFENMMKPVASARGGRADFGAADVRRADSQRELCAHQTIEPPSPVFTEPDGQVVGEGEFPRLESATQPSANGKVVVLVDYRRPRPCARLPRDARRDDAGSAELHPVLDIHAGHHVRQANLGRSPGGLRRRFNDRRS